MRPEQWKLFKSAARLEPVDRVPVALIVDSPWIPGYAGVSHLDYYLDPDLFFRLNARLMDEFPEVIFLPSWWVEYGMAIEPSAIGSRIIFAQDQPPSQVPSLKSLADVDQMPSVNPWSDAFMAIALHRYRREKQRIFDAGFTIPLVTARGPLCTAGFIRGLTTLMVDLVEDPEGVHKLLAYTTKVTIDWLKAQQEAIGDSVEGIFILDDIPGLLSRRFYKEFADPYMRQVCDAFPKEWIKVYHNDANIKPFVEDLGTVGFDVLNWSHNFPVADIRKRTAGKLCLMGNVAPLDLGVKGTPEQVFDAARAVLAESGGEGLILSFGGGVSPGTPVENIRALVGAARGFHRQ
jgi:uroporphyrinogen-III decarboxylase